MDDGVDEGVVDGGGFGDDSRHRFGVGAEVAPVPGRGGRWYGSRERFRGSE